MSHKANGEAIYLFRELGSGELQYVSEAEYVDHHTEVAPDREGNARNAIVFELSMIIDTTAAGVADVSVATPKERATVWNKSLDGLRKAALADLPNDATPKERKVTVRRRSEAVRVYVRRRANGICEGCRDPAPFETADGKPYLEPHHTRRLADGGPDHPRWVIALSPNCHKRVQHGADGVEYNKQLMEQLGEIEIVH